MIFDFKHTVLIVFMDQCIKQTNYIDSLCVVMQGLALKKVAKFSHIHSFPFHGEIFNTI